MIKSVLGVCVRVCVWEVVVGCMRVCDGCGESLRARLWLTILFSVSERGTHELKNESVCYKCLLI